MSRNLPPKVSVKLTEEESAVRSTVGGKLLFTHHKGAGCALLLQHDRLTAISLEACSQSRIGAVYIGKIKNIAGNIDACFVEIADRELCFLPLKDITAPFLINRNYDGRVLAGDELLVQIERDAQKTKQASVTTHISLSNDCFAFALGNSHIGFSAKMSHEQKKALRQILADNGISENGCLTGQLEHILSPSDYASLAQESGGEVHIKLPSVGLVVRTKAAQLTESPEKLMEQYYELSIRFVRLLNSSLHRSCFSCLKEAPGYCEQVLTRLAAEEEYNEIVTDDATLFEQLTIYEAERGFEKKIRLYEDTHISLGNLYALDSKLDTALNARVWLKSGGYLIIEPTEALTVIDVNSGKYEVRKANNEETALKINLEAAEEIALQLRLRNLSGIIIADFINMEKESSKEQLLEYLRRQTKKDRVQTTVVDMTPLGLVEITRKKSSKPLHEQIRSITSWN